MKKLFTGGRALEARGTQTGAVGVCGDGTGLPKVKEEGSMYSQIRRRWLSKDRRGGGTSGGGGSGAASADEPELLLSTPATAEATVAVAEAISREDDGGKGLMFCCPTRYLSWGAWGGRVG